MAAKDSAPKKGSAVLEKGACGAPNEPAVLQQKAAQRGLRRS